MTSQQWMYVKFACLVPFAICGVWMAVGAVQSTFIILAVIAVASAAGFKLAGDQESKAKAAELRRD